MSHAGEGARPLFRTGPSPAHDQGRSGTGGLFDGRPAKRLTMQDAIGMALKNNLDARIERTGISIARARIRFAAGAFDPVFSIRTSRESLRRLENVNDVRTTDVLRQERAITAQNDLTNAIRAQQGLPPLTRTDVSTGIAGVSFDVQTTRTNIALEGRTPWGMRYGFEVEANRIRNTFTNDTREIVPEYQTFAGITVIQPLLRNFGPAANLAEVRIARHTRRVQEYEWKDKVSSAVQSVMATYFEMLFGVADMGVRRDAVLAGEKLVAQNQRRMELGFGQPYDVQNSRAQVSVDQEQLLASKNLFMERQFALKRLITAKFDLNDAEIFMPIPVPNLPVPVLDRSAFLRDAFANRPDFQQALIQADAEDVRLRFAHNQLLPQLDVVASYGVNGLNGTYESSFERGFRGHQPAWVLGLNVQVPLANMQARARLAEIRATKEQALLRIAQTELTIGVDVDTIISRIETGRQRVETARKTRELYEQAVHIAYRKFEEGQFSTVDVIEQQRRLYEAKSRELGTQTDLNRAITQLWLVTGTVLEKSGIQIQIDPRAK